MKTFTTGQLAKRTNVNLETIRFFERKGLLPEPPRNKSGHRQYSIKDLRRAEFIIRTKSLGFSLQDISNLLLLRVESGKTCVDVKQNMKAKLMDIRGKIEALQRMEKVLQSIEAKCPGQGPLNKRSILKTLDQ